MHTGNTKERVERYVNEWKARCYFHGVPEEVPRMIAEAGLAPSWKAIAIALLKNDMQMTSLGFTAKQSAWYGVLKRIELKKDNWVQLRLF